MVDIQQKIGFDRQGFVAGNCAQRALVHSLLLLGIPVSMLAAHRRTGVSWLATTMVATTEGALLRGIARCKCIAHPYEIRRKRKAKQLIDGFLKDGKPVIINTEESDHWMVLAGRYSKDKYYWIDSDDSAVYGFATWNKIAWWMEYGNRYYLIGISPPTDDHLRHSIVQEFSEVYELLRDNELAEWWGYYLEDLTEIFDCPKTGEVYNANEIFDKLSQKIVESVDYYSGLGRKRELKWELGNYRKVAQAHRLTLSKERLEDATIDLAVTLSFIA
jgi:hypothetical protein